MRKHDNKLSIGEGEIAPEICLSGSGRSKAPLTKPTDCSAGKVSSFGGSLNLSRFIGRSGISLTDLGLGLFFLVLTQIFLVSNLNPFEKNWRRDTFYQKYYGTVVMSTCGRGFFAPAGPKIPALDRFLDLRSDTFSCSELPATMRTGPPTYNAVNNYYLARSVELAWRLNGEISWKGLKPLLGMFCSMTTALSYLVFRLGMGRFLATLGMLYFFALHVPSTPSVRHYAKMPFFMLYFVLLGIMVKGPMTRSKLFWLAAGAGTTVGIGLGFRRDILLAIPPTILVIICFLPAFPGKSLRLRFMAALLFAAIVAICYAPTLQHERTVFANTHVAAAGFSNRLTEKLGLQDSLYEWGHVFADSWIEYQIRAYAAFGKGIKEFVRMYSPQYNSLGGMFLTEIVHDFPADILIRGYGAVVQIVKMPIAFATLLLVIGTFSTRRALFLFFFLLYFSGYTATQFLPDKNALYLQFLPFWLTGLGLHESLLLASRTLTIWRVEGGLGVRNTFVAWWRASAERIVYTTLVALLVFFVPLAAARIYQSARVGEILQDYDQAELVTLARMPVELRSGDLVRLQVPELLTPLPTLRSHDEVSIGYLVVEVFETSCERESIRFTLRYEPGLYNDFSRAIEVDLTTNGTTKIFAPIYSRDNSSYGVSRFLGVEVDSEGAECLRLSRVSDLHRFPPVVYIFLPENWRQLRLYQTLVEVPGWPGFEETLSRARFRWRKILESLKKKARRPWFSRRPSGVRASGAGTIFGDGFESGDVSGWSTSYGHASVDDSAAVLARLEREVEIVRTVTLSRNFGQHPATVAGILHTSGDWVMTLNEELQHRPDDIGELLKMATTEGLDVVYARPSGALHRSLAVRDTVKT